MTYYDLAALWRTFYTMAGAKTYGLTEKPITTPCYNSTTGGLCAKPATFLYFDTLHPVTTIHKVIANKLTALVNAALA